MKNYKIIEIKSISRGSIGQGGKYRPGISRTTLHDVYKYFFSLRNVPGVLKRPKNKNKNFFLGGGGGEKFQFFSLLKFKKKKMFLGF